MRHLRRALPIDAAELAAVEAGQPMSAGWGEAGFVTELAHNFAFVWCAVEAGQIIGFVAVRQVADFCEILNLAVSPLHCRQGIGAGLLAKLFSELKQKDCREVTLEVNYRNAAAIGLYQKMGFTQTGRREKFYHGTDDALILGVKL